VPDLKCKWNTLYISGGLFEPTREIESASLIVISESETLLETMQPTK
jgi:hypothetical protein